MIDQQMKATHFRARHHASEPLVLANAWDAASARIFQQVGLTAIATTSAGIAFSYGYPDGERIPLNEMLEAVARICSSVSIPVTADMEAGYGDSPEEVERVIEAVIQAGAVGVNLEDSKHNPTRSSLIEIPLQVERLRAAKEAAIKSDVDIVLNARTDVYLRPDSSVRARFEEALRRGRAYRDAGADCVFIPGLIDRETIADAVRELACPINILAGASSPSIPELWASGVARVSLGSAPMRATLTLLRRVGEEILTTGTYSALENILSHQSMNDLMRSSLRLKPPA